MAAKLGRDWSTLRVTFKPYPVCAFNQTPVTAALALREKLRGADVRAVRVRMNPYETGYAGMDATGPFESISGTLMSIPFCIAVTLLYGVPDMRRMTTYDDPKVNEFIGRIKLISDPSVPTLSAVIEAEIAEGLSVIQDQRMTTKDFAYDRATASKLVRRIGVEQNVSSTAFDRLETFVDRWPVESIDSILTAFAMIEPKRHAA